MKLTKFDAALNIHLAKHREGVVEVSIRLNSPLTEEEVAQMQKMGVTCADTRRRVLFASLTPTALSNLAKIDKIIQLSLVQKMELKVYEAGQIPPITK